MRGPREERRRMLALRGGKRMMGFNVNCSDCIYCGILRNIVDEDKPDRYVCCHPRMVLSAGHFWPIEDINQNVDCCFYEDYKNGN